ncbi:fatty acid desaturase-domain-containing protein [Dactylonectria estremocensis]|uniref:Delta 8-(E)-sphingolipid desaturase n=1 Tax=Dactylonectria estremocensis TaxID=1079267 RepID=A0A9P9F3E2_9HYPO|nr:fatty acid desaturase-domain-containing protein [Dactylonectria estremocensis]
MSHAAVAPLRMTGLPPLPADATKGTARVLPHMSRDEIEAMIADGRNIIILHGQVVRVDPWLKYHPGGDKAMLHMVGKDASDEIDALHSLDARQQMMRYRIGRVEGSWANFSPPIQGGVFRTRAEIEAANHVDGSKDTISSSPATSRTPSPVFDDDGDARGIRNRIGVRDKTNAGAGSVSSASSVHDEMDGMSYLDTVTLEHIRLDLEKYPAPDKATQASIAAKYRELHQRVYDTGLYNCNYRAYAVECCRYVLLAIGMFAGLHYEQYFIAALCLGALWHQLVFAAHDAGHMGITHKFQIDTVIGIMIADFIGGLSMGWWKRNHNVHHIVTNAPEHDPDIEHMPLFAVSHRLLGSLRSTYYDRVMEYNAVAKVLLSIQTWTYYPLLALGRFNLYVQSWDYLLAGRGPTKGPAAWHRWLEITGQIFFWIWFGYGVLYKTIPDGWSRFTFIMVSHITSSPLHVQIVLSHFAMSTADLGPQESFAQKMLRTTMDVDCPEWLDFFHGGLQFQVIHHLFPRVPRHNLRKTQKLVQEFCDEVGIPYALYGFANSNKQVIGRLAEVSRQAAILAKCQRSIIESGDYSGHHIHH